MVLLAVHRTGPEHCRRRQGHKQPGRRRHQRRQLKPYKPQPRRMPPLKQRRRRRRSLRRHLQHNPRKPESPHGDEGSHCCTISAGEEIVYTPLFLFLLFSSHCGLIGSRASGAHPGMYST